MNSLEYNKIVSLGSNCEVGIALRSRSLKTESYPFDWIWSNISFIIDIFKNRTKQIDLDSFNLIIGKEHLYLHNHQIMLVHDFDDYVNIVKTEENKNELKSKLKSVTETYNRRLERLTNLCLSGKRILFVRLSKINGPSELKEQDSVEKVIELIHAIEDSYPNLDFKLLYLDYYKGNNEDKAINIHNHPRLLYDIVDRNMESEPVQCFNELGQIKKI